MKKWISAFVNRVKGMFPTALPQGRTEFDAWAERIFNAWTLPTDSIRDVRYMLATMVIHLGAQVSRKPDYFFVVSIRAAAAKQVSAAVFQEIKQAQMEESKPKQPEVTQLKAVPSGESQK